MPHYLTYWKNMPKFYIQMITIMKNIILSELQKCNDQIVLKNVLHLLQRSNIWVKKYWVTLQENNLKLSDRINHAREESLDFANYLTKIESINKQNSSRWFNIWDTINWRELWSWIDPLDWSLLEKVIVEKYSYIWNEVNDDNKNYFWSWWREYLAY